jgi:hypothetical protein
VLWHCCAVFAGVDLGGEFLVLTDPAVETLTAQHADFDLHHVEPAGVLG